jgi:NAD(P)-dependent dehydrogenase (short-subunit alcohol dehydrogenase family)
VLNVDEPGPQLGLQLGLQGKAALVVGGGFGIGRSAARMLAAQGSRLALMDLDAERVKAASRELSAFGLRADVREPGAARAAVRDASAELGGLDILVNIVGRGLAARAADVTAAVQREVLETNYLHHVEFCSAFAQAAIADGRPGVITMVSSLAGVAPFPGQAAYGAAKAALISYTASLAVELGPHQIRVNTVAPGIVRTDRNTRDSDADRELERAIPLGRIADQSEIASVIVFLSSAGASYLTGQTLVLDGGASHYLRFWP